MTVIVPSVVTPANVGRIIEDAMFAARILGADNSAQAGDVQLCLRRLQRLIDLWANMSLLVFAPTIESFTFTAGTASYSTGALAGGRPVSIVGMRVNIDGIDYPVDPIVQSVWNDIPYKDTPGIPFSCFYDATMNDGTMNFYYVPAGEYTCYVDSLRPVASDLTTATNLYLPPGYEAALVDSLAVDIWPSFKPGQISPDLKLSAQNAVRALKRTNYRTLVMNTPFDRLSNTAYGSWRG